MSPLAPTLQLFFRERLANQRQASPATIVSYRNTFRLLLRFVRDPEHAELIQQVLAIPQKRFDKTIVSFLELVRPRRRSPRRTLAPAAARRLRRCHSLLWGSAARPPHRATNCLTDL
jgi:hypothetical protein